MKAPPLICQQELRWWFRYEDSPTDLTCVLTCEMTGWNETFGSESGGSLSAVLDVEEIKDYDCLPLQSRSKSSPSSLDLPRSFISPLA